MEVVSVSWKEEAIPLSKGAVFHAPEIRGYSISSFKSMDRADVCHVLLE